MENPNTLAPQVKASAPVVNGTEKTKSVLKLLISAINAIHTAKADGKIDLSDLGVMLSLIPNIAPGIDGLKAVGGEMKDLTTEEVAELSKFVNTELKIEDAKAKEVIEGAFKILGDIVAMVAILKK